jgi:hypothetical protein
MDSVARRKVGGGALLKKQLNTPPAARLSLNDGSMSAVRIMLLWWTLLRWTARAMGRVLLGQPRGPAERPGQAGLSITVEHPVARTGLFQGRQHVQAFVSSVRVSIARLCPPHPFLPSLPQRMDRWGGGDDDDKQ